MTKIRIVTINNDQTTNEILDWLRYYNPCTSIDRLNLKSDFLKLNKINEKSTIYIRKYRHLFESNIGKGYEVKPFNKKTELIDYLQKSTNDEIKIFIEHLMCSEKNNIIGNKNSFGENKLNWLEKAQKADLDIPKTLITNCKEELFNFISECNSDIIIKPLYNAISYNYKKKLYVSYTNRLSNDLLNKLPKYFPVGLFQQEIKKEFEIRTFYFYGQCYSMAIFTQQNKQTSVDFRMYSNEKPNRMVPYLLSNEVKNKIQILMNKLNLNTGSLDFIKGVDDKLYFLEVNPEGQFGMVSKPCNYYLEELVAKKIIDAIN